MPTAEADTTELLYGALIQHGRNSDRIYLMDPANSDPVTLPAQLEMLAGEHGYGKIFAKLPAEKAELFIQAGYVREGAVPGMYSGEQDGVFLGKFRKAGRREEDGDTLEQRKKVLATALNAASSSSPAEYPVERAGVADLPELASLYSAVFPRYPFPVQDPDFLREELEAHTVYFLVREGGRIIAAASYEYHPVYRYAEMTDFATHPEVRGRGLASILLRQMEKHAAAAGILTAFTIARACSFGMNLVFGRAGYGFGGALVNNTMIGETIETMHVWYRSLG